jgi:hypothetical protein
MFAKDTSQRRRVRIAGAILHRKLRLNNGCGSKVHCPIMRPLPQRRNRAEGSGHDWQGGIDARRAPPQVSLSGHTPKTVDLESQHFIDNRFRPEDH